MNSVTRNLLYRLNVLVERLNIDTTDKDTNQLAKEVISVLLDSYQSKNFYTSTTKDWCKNRNNNASTTMDIRRMRSLLCCLNGKYGVYENDTLIAISNVTDDGSVPIQKVVKAIMNGVEQCKVEELV